MAEDRLAEAREEKPADVSGNGASEADKMEGLQARLRKEARKRQIDLGQLKSGGYIKERQKDLFTIRLRVPGGRLSLERMRKIVEVAEKYGGEFVHLSVRQSVEIPHVHIDHFDAIAADLEEVGQKVASCGPRVRVPTACGGCEYNPNGLTDSQNMALEVDRRYFGTPTHHKFKVTFSGCPIDCPHARQADLGFVGSVKPELIPELCTACGLCVKACQEGALEMFNDLPVRDEEKCTRCGDCIKVCPFDSMVPGEVGHSVYAGGKGGKHPRWADKVSGKDIYSDEEALGIIEKVLAWYEEIGVRGERLGHTIDRVGLDRFKEEVFGEGA